MNAVPCDRIAGTPTQGVDEESAVQIRRNSHYRQSRNAHRPVP